MKKSLLNLALRVLFFLVLSAALIYVTHSLWMSVGIVLILFAADQTIANWQHRRRVHEVFEKLRQAGQADKADKTGQAAKAAKREKNK